jgi:membrane-associated phospholipid phosphatase
MALRDRLIAAAPGGRARAALISLVAAVVVLTVLVENGAFTWLDQFSLDHLMPWLDPLAKSGGGMVGYYRPFSASTPAGAKLLDVWTYPCSLLLSALVVGGATVALWRRVDPVAALAPVAAWVVGNGIEVIGKHTVTRPPLYGHAGALDIHVPAFDDSYPSGHMIRGIVVAYSIVLLWPRSLPWVALWVAFVPVALVVQGSHTITDVIAGAMIGAILVVLMAALVRSAPVVQPRPQPQR